MALLRSTDILLVGKTGYGKSATANSIVGYKAFDSQPSCESVTKTAQFEFGVFEGRILKVVDGPGVADTSLRGEKSARLVADAMSFAVAANPHGYHAILFILPFGGRYTQEDVDTVRILKDIFGPDFIRDHGILLMTRGDNFEPEEMGDFESWIGSQSGAVSDLLQEFGSRVILFDNKCQDPEVRARQVGRLLKLIDQLAGNGARYTSEIFNKAKECRDKLITDSKIPQLSEESMMDCSLITQDFERVDYDKPEVTVRRTETLKVRAEKLLENVIKEDMGSNRLSGTIKLTKQIQEALEDQMLTASECLRLTQDTQGNAEIEGENDLEKIHVDLQRTQLKINNDKGLGTIRENYQRVKQEAAWTWQTVAGALAVPVYDSIKLWWSPGSTSC